MLIDSHCHLPHKKYPKSLDQLLADAQKAGVTKFINIGTSLDENSQTLEVSASYENVFSAIAIYPHEDLGITLEKLQKQLSTQLNISKKIVAVGECGLDITEWQGGRPVAEQITLFEMQLDLAVKHKLPVVIHNRGGDDLIFEILQPFVNQGLKGVAHCFASTQRVAQSYLDSGFYLSFSGMLTYKGREELREVAKWAPVDRIIVETDAPYLPPQQYRGQVNEPAHVVEVVRKLAELRNADFDAMCLKTYENTCTLFNL